MKYLDPRVTAGRCCKNLPDVQVKLNVQYVTGGVCPIRTTGHPCAAAMGSAPRSHYLDRLGSHRVCTMRDTLCVQLSRKSPVLVTIKVEELSADQQPQQQAV